MLDFPGSGTFLGIAAPEICGAGLCGGAKSNSNLARRAKLDVRSRRRRLVSGRLRLRGLGRSPVCFCVMFFWRAVSADEVGAFLFSPPGDEEDEAIRRWIVEGAWCN